MGRLAGPLTQLLPLLPTGRGPSWGVWVLNSQCLDLTEKNEFYRDLELESPLSVLVGDGVTGRGLQLQATSYLWQCR